MHPLVSIVIPVYNREKFISQAVESAMNQTYQNIEIIIVDNKSTDNTWSILQDCANKDSRIKIFQNPENLGPVLNWNECFKKSHGDYIKILWSDDWMSVDFIEKAILLFDINTAFVFSGYTIINGSSSIANFSFKEKYESQYYQASLLTHNIDNFPVSPGCAIFRGEDLINAFFCKSVPNLDNLDSMKNGAGNDLLLFLDISSKYKYIKSTGSIDSFFREHATSFSSAKDIYLYYMWAKLYYIKNNNVHYSIINKFKIILSRDKKYKKAYYSLNYRINSFRDLYNIISFIGVMFTSKVKRIFT